MESAGMMRWLLTYADMITLLLIFFIVMYSVAAENQEDIKKLLENLRATFGGIMTGGKAPMNTGSASEILPFSLSDYNVQYSQAKIKITDLTKRGLPGHVLVRYNERGLVISLLTDEVVFDKGKADLKPAAKKVLSDVADVIKKMPNQIAVEGHTDDSPVKGGLYPSNWELSTARASSVVRYLIEQKNIPPSRLSAAGYAQYKPLLPNTVESNKTLNRRVDIVLLQIEPSKKTGEVAVPQAPFLSPEEAIQVNWK